MKCIETVPHEFTSNYIFPKHDLKPFFGADAVVKQSGGSTGFIEFEHAGERWQARLRAESSNILPPTGGLLPSGRSFDIEEVKEYRLKVRRHPEEDPVGEQKVDEIGRAHV